jgi:hypothetical protein
MIGSQGIGAMATGAVAPIQCFPVLNR